MAHARRLGGDDDPGEMESYLRAYYAHVDPADLAERSVEDLFGMAADHRRLGMEWTSGSVAMNVFNPKIEIGGWHCEHTVVLIVTDDLPFLVDSVTMALSSLNLAIHLVVHPVLADRRSEGDGFANPRHHDDGHDKHCSFMAIEVDRQTDPAQLELVEERLRHVLADVRVSVEDWAPMRERMLTIADSLASEPLPLAEDEVAEAEELLRWLAHDHFIFLGYREYSLGGNELTADPDAGLGILRAGHGRPVTPRKLSDLPPQVRTRVREPRLLNLTKATAKATVHRASHMDYVGVKTFDADGEVTGERRFIGLYTNEVYTRSVTQVPRVRRLVQGVLRRASFPPGGHDEKRLLNILESYPRDELLQIDEDELFETALAIAGLQERRRARLFARTELFGRFVTCMVYMPRDRYNTITRSAIQKLLVEAYGGTDAEWSTRITESVLARLLIHIRIDDGSAAEVDVAGLEAQIEHLLRDWADDFAYELSAHLGEDVGVALARTFTEAFPPAYQAAFSPRAAVADVQQLEQLEANGELRLSVYREPGQPNAAFKLKIYRRGERVSLTSIMPSLTNLGVTVVDERPYQIRPSGREPVWIYDFSLEYPELELEFGEASRLLEETFHAVWHGRVADDGLNRLVLSSGMSASEISVLRSYAAYLQQTGITYSQGYVRRTLAQHPMAARRLVELFAARFDPDEAERETACATISNAFFEIVDEITSLNQDRILRRFHNLIESTLRTNRYQLDAHGQRSPYVAVKLDPRALTELPEPRPMFEIFVFSPRFEGVHLRAGPVARGGLRWSDRNEDYRTEVLGLVKAQMVKNAVIVPSGAKGGFVLKQRPEDGDRAALQEEVVTCYQLFISALLDLTDNLVDGEVVPPERTVRYDGDDTYLVVAADKGTATFSDIANELAVSRGFWLGDAFASGGSHGYDHKAMGITARGAWESVKRHFRELGRDIQHEPFTAVGIGDMSGDVFGNGMLLSAHTRLIAAFDHRHVFIDPAPDEQTAFAERARLFKLPASSWADYDEALISEGGGVYPRTAKSIELSDEARRVLDIDAQHLTPDELISTILRAPVDLLWNGGIGTYVKASTEPHADVGDKANDAIRVSARDLRVQVIGEGGNLGVTQRGRIEFAQRDGRIYTDAIDNAGGVDCSDHEVNIKILLNQVVASGDLTEKQRNELLAQMTNEVALLVLADNYNQTQALSTERLEAASMVDVHARYLAHLEGRGQLDRSLENLPDADEMAERRLADAGLATPELAVLLAYTKNTLNEDLLASSVPDEDVWTQLLMAYFPHPLRERYPGEIANHRLRREIVANRISNQVVDRGGTSMVYRVTQETSAPAHDVAAAHMAAWEIFELDQLSRSVNFLEDHLSADRQLAIHLSGRQLAERATRLLVRNRPYPFNAASAIAELAEPVQETIDQLPDYLAGSDLLVFEAEKKELMAHHMPEELAVRVAALAPSLAALDIVEVARETGVPAPTVAAVHFEVADKLDLNWLRDRILALPRDTQWATLARLTLRGDLYTDHRAVTTRVVDQAAHAPPQELVDRWMQSHDGPVGYYRRTMSEIRAAGPTDLTTLLVAGREVRSLLARTSPAA